MAYSINGLAEDIETVSETMGALIERDWTKSNTTEILPFFAYDETKPHMIPNSSQDDYIKIEEGSSSGFSEINNALDNSQGSFEEDVIITINSPDQISGRLFEHEIIRILRNNFRGIIKKSDNTNDSGIKRWDWPIPKFTRFSVGVSGQRKSFKSQMLLTVISNYEWSP